MGGQEFHTGDKVSWQSHGNTVTGEVVETITSGTEAAGRTVKGLDGEAAVPGGQRQRRQRRRAQTGCPDQALRPRTLPSGSKRE